MTKSLRLLIALAVAVLGVVAFTVPASAQTTSTGGTPVIIVPPSGPPGGVTTLTGDGFPPGNEVTVTLDGVVLGTVLVRPDGTFSFDFQLPTECGTYTLTATDGTIVRTSEIAVTGCAVTPSGALPFTGGDSAPILQVGVALLAAGALITLVVRKRSTGPTA